MRTPVTSVVHIPRSSRGSNAPLPVQLPATPAHRISQVRRKRNRSTGHYISETPTRRNRIISLWLKDETDTSGCLQKRAAADDRTKSIANTERLSRAVRACLGKLMLKLRHEANASPRNKSGDVSNPIQNSDG